MPVIDPATVPATLGSDYPPPLDAPVRARRVRALGDAAGMRELAVNHVTLPPGSWSSQRHWHEGEDEVLVVIAGTAVLIDDDGDRPLRPGDVAIFPAGDGNAHHLVNRGSVDCVFVVTGRRQASPVHYPDVDMAWHPDRGITRRNGDPVE